MNNPSHAPFERLESLMELLDTQDEIHVNKKYRVFCNRDINFAELEAIGFDMDYTLAPYHQVEMDKLSVELTVERLIEHKGYPTSLRTLEPKADFAIRGLVLDTKLGNILKLDSHRHVGRAYHGFRPLTDDELEAYKQEAISFDGERYVFYDTLYALPEAFLYAALVDFIETQPDVLQKSWTTLYEDIRFSIDLAHRDGSFKKAIMEDTAKFVKRSDRLAVTLHRLRSAGKKLFLLTNSYPEYTEHLMTYLLDGAMPEYKSWRHYFDIIVAGGSKPSFFTKQTPFYIVDDESLETVGEEHKALDKNTMYLHGNLKEFTEMSGISPSKVLYVGDHIYGDILRPKKSSTWRTCMLIQEMEEEMALSGQMNEEYAYLCNVEEELARLTQELGYINWLDHHIEQLRASQTLSDDDLNTSKTKVRQHRDRLKRRHRDLLAQLLEKEKALESQYNPYWGPIFTMHNKNSVFGEQVEDYACLYTSRVANFANYSPLHYYRAPRQPMPHEMGK